MTKEFRPGDKVEWPSGTGKSVGTIQAKITDKTKVNGQQVDASLEAPRYLVENDRTGKVTSHLPNTLSALGSGSQTNDFQPGDKVEWNTAQGKTVGTVQEKITQPISIKDYDVQASKDNPKYVIESDQTGKKAAHKPEALDKV